MEPSVSSTFSRYAAGSVLGLSEPAGWLAACASLLATGHTALMAACAVLCTLSALRAAAALRRRALLCGQRAGFQSMGALRRRMRKESAWIGLGFAWSTPQAELLYGLTGEPRGRWFLPRPVRLLLGAGRGLADTAAGDPRIHGLGASEHGLYVPLKSLEGGTCICGTTQSGKGVLLSSLVSETILSGDAVVVIDPKGSERLERAVAAACAAADRPPALVLRPGAASSVRINPLADFETPSQIASRICAVLPAGIDGAFAAFAWMAANAAAGAEVALGSVPTLASVAGNLSRGLSGLAQRLARQIVSEHCPQALSDLPEDPRELQRAVSRLEAAGRIPRSGAPGNCLAAAAHDPVHWEKITSSLAPVLAVLTGGALADVLSLDGSTCPQAPAASLSQIVESRSVLLASLEALADPAVATAIGAILLSDLAAVCGQRYKSRQAGLAAPPVWLFVDETANVINQPLIEILNKGAESGIRATCAMQAVSDLAARLGSDAAARMALGNLNNLFVLRCKDRFTAEWATEMFGSVPLACEGLSVSSRLAAGLNTGQAVTRSLATRRAPLVAPEVLGSLPNLEWFALVQGGHLYKGRSLLLRTS